MGSLSISQFNWIELIVYHCYCFCTNVCKLNAEYLFIVPGTKNQLALFARKKKTHSLIIHTTCVRWNSSMRPCRTFFQYQLISTMSFFISLLNLFFTILKWNALDFSTYAQLKWLIRSGQNCALHRHTC